MKSFLLRCLSKAYKNQSDYSSDDFHGFSALNIPKTLIPTAKNSLQVSHDRTLRVMFSGGGNQHGLSESNRECQDTPADNLASRSPPKASISA